MRRRPPSYPDPGYPGGRHGRPAGGGAGDGGPGYGAAGYRDPGHGGQGGAGQGYRDAGYPGQGDAGQGYRDPGYGGQGRPGPGYRDAGYGGQGDWGPGDPGPGDGGPGYRGPGGSRAAGRGPRRTTRAASGRRRLRLGLSLALAACAVIGGGAYLLLSHAGGLSAQGGGNPAPTSVSHSAVPVALHHGDLRKFLLAAPSGSHPWPHPLGTNRKLSLSQVASLSTNSKARRQTLTQDHFTHGAVQSWITGGGTWIDVRLYQFASAADAQSFFHKDIEASAGSTPEANQSGVSQVPGARAFADSKPDSSGYISVLAIGVKADVVFLADVAQHSTSAHLGMPDKLMQEQFGKL